MSAKPGDKEIRVFISYSHLDKEWLNKLQTMLAPLRRAGNTDIWDDTRIKPGSEWKVEIEQALDRANVAVLLVSPNFLASDFIVNEELPPLLDAREKRGLRVLWVPISYCLYECTPLAKYQAASDPSHPLDTLTPPEQNRVLHAIGQQIQDSLRP